MRDWPRHKKECKKRLPVVANNEDEGEVRMQAARVSGLYMQIASVHRCARHARRHRLARAAGSEAMASSCADGSPSGADSRSRRAT